MGTIIAIVLGGLYGAGVYLWGYFTGKREGYNTGYNFGIMAGMKRSLLFGFGNHVGTVNETKEKSGAE